MPKREKTPKELMEINEGRVLQKQKDEERKEKSRLYNLEMKLRNQLIRKEEAKERAKERYWLKKENSPK